MKYYTGIGSRETPTHICVMMSLLARILARKNYCLRSGGAKGADSAFEKNATAMQIFLPWNGFESKFVDNERYFVPPYREDLVQQFHPNPNRLSSGGLKLMSRNTYQVLGPELNDPSDFVICWTKDGKLSGGTAQALRIAKHYNVPIFNLFHHSDREKLSNLLLFEGLTFS